MRFTQAMISLDPGVQTAFKERSRALTEGLENAQQWAREQGGDGGIVGSLRHGAYQVVAITADRCPAGKWRRRPSVQGDSLAFAPRTGSTEEQQMQALAVNILPIPGLPLWFTGRKSNGKPVTGSPEIFTHEGASYYVLPFVPDEKQPGVVAPGGNWTPVALADAKALLAAHNDIRASGTEAGLTA